MIAQIEGKLLKLDSDTALVQVGPVAYEVMLPGYVVNALAGKIGSEITLCTMQYYEGSPQGAIMQPRIIGFLSPAEKDFFTKFISVKGIGIKKGLRSLNIPIATIASAIENGDDKTLIALPEVGKRLAQQIIAELKGKLASFAVGAAPAVAEEKFELFQTEALEILKTNWIDIILSDLHMPEMDGAAFLQTLRAHNLWRSIPVVLITTESRQDVLTPILQRGVQGCIKKPFQPETIRNQLVNILGEAAAPNVRELEGCDF